MFIIDWRAAGKASKRGVLPAPGRPVSSGIHCVVVLYISRGFSRDGVPGFVTCYALALSSHSIRTAIHLSEHRGDVYDNATGGGITCCRHRKLEVNGANRNDDAVMENCAASADDSGMPSAPV